MKSRWIRAGGLLLVAGGAGYMAWISWAAGDDGRWLFGVFALFFGALTAAALRPPSPAAQPAKSRTSSGFVSHWKMFLVTLGIVAVFVAAVVTALLQR